MVNLYIMTRLAIIYSIRYADKRQDNLSHEFILRLSCHEDVKDPNLIVLQ